MKKTYLNNHNLFITIALVCIFCYFNSLKAQSKEETIKKYIQQYKEVAIEQMVLYKIPASVIMAQAIKESSYGTSFLASNTNNHFGIKCHREWGGNTFNKDDDTLNECFRSYKSVEDSYLDHSLFLVSRPRYSFLFELGLYNYQAWCFGLKDAGYATSPPYAFDLISIIENYKLYELDKFNYLPQSCKPQELLALNIPEIISSPQPDILAFENKENLFAAVFYKQTTEEQPIFVSANTSDKKSN